MSKKDTTMLPETIFVFHEQEDDAGYLIASSTREEAAPGIGTKRLVGKYRLIETGEIEQRSIYRRL